MSCIKCYTLSEVIILKKIVKDKKKLKTYSFKELDSMALAQISGGRKKHKCRVYNNGMPTGIYRWC